MFKKISMKKFTNLIGYSVVCFAYMLTNILLIGAMTETIKINNIYLAAVIGSPILTIFVTQALLKWFFVIENENERKNEKNDVIHGRYSCWSMDPLYDHRTAELSVSDHVIGHSGMGNSFDHASAKRERADTETPCDAGH